MAESASILIADDEESFRESTGRLLQREGFQCRGVQDADEAIASLQHRRFDLLIADIRMPHNDDFRLVRKSRDLDREMAVIVATGYPSTDTAIRSVELPVAAYMTKPLDFDELLGHVRSILKSSRRRRAIAAVAERLETCLADLEALTGQAGYSHGETAEVPAATIRTLAACLSELLSLSAGPAPERRWQNLCELLDCPHRAVHRQAIVEAITVLKKTKDTFKSKPLAVLREKLERVVGRL